MATYEVRKNNINDFKYIVFKHDKERYKVQKLGDDVYLWVDKPTLEAYLDLQLLKTTKSNCDSEDFDALYTIAMNYLKGTPKNITLNVSIEFVISALQSRYDEVKDLFGNRASQQLWGQVLEVVEACGINANIASPSEFVDNYLINGEFISKKDVNCWLVGDSEELLQDEISEKWLEYCENNACLYNDYHACLSF